MYEQCWAANCYVEIIQREHYFLMSEGSAVTFGSKRVVNRHE